MEEVITALGNFGSPSGYVPLVLRVMVVLGMIGRVGCSSGLRVTEVWVTDVLLSDALPVWLGPASPQVSTARAAVCGQGWEGHFCSYRRWKLPINPRGSAAALK